MSDEKREAKRRLIKFLQCDERYAVPLREELLWLMLKYIGATWELSREQRDVMKPILLEKVVSTLKRICMTPQVRAVEMTRAPGRGAVQQKNIIFSDELTSIAEQLMQSITQNELQSDNNIFMKRLTLALMMKCCDYKFRLQYREPTYEQRFWLQEFISDKKQTKPVADTIFSDACNVRVNFKAEVAEVDEVMQTAAYQAKLIAGRSVLMTIVIIYLSWSILSNIVSGKPISPVHFILLPLLVTVFMRLPDYDVMSTAVKNWQQAAGLALHNIRQNGTLADLGAAFDQAAHARKSNQLACAQDLPDEFLAGLNIKLAAGVKWFESTLVTSRPQPKGPRARPGSASAAASGDLDALIYGGAGVIGPSSHSASAACSPRSTTYAAMPVRLSAAAGAENQLTITWTVDSQELSYDSNRPGNIIKLWSLKPGFPQKTYVYWDEANIKRLIKNESHRVHFLETAFVGHWVGAENQSGFKVRISTDNGIELKTKDRMLGDYRLLFGLKTTTDSGERLYVANDYGRHTAVARRN